MLKLLLTLAVVVFALMWWFGKGRVKGPPAAGSRAPGKAPPALAPVEMVACAHCGLHLPRGDALPGERHGGGGAERWFCGAEHRRLGAGAAR